MQIIHKHLIASPGHTTGLLDICHHYIDPLFFLQRNLSTNQSFDSISYAIEVTFRKWIKNNYHVHVFIFFFDCFFTLILKMQSNTQQYHRFYAVYKTYFSSGTWILDLSHDQIWANWLADVTWRRKSPASRLFTQPFIQAQIKVNIKAPRHWPMWIPRRKGQWRGKCFHLMTSSW